MKKLHLFCIYWVGFIGLLALSLYLFKTSTYTSYQDVPVEYIKRYTTQSCYKGHCHEEYNGLFKRLSDGYVFDRSIKPRMYHTYPVGSRYEMHIRPFDIQQNPTDNLIYLFLAPFVYLVTMISFVATSAFSLGEYLNRRRYK